MITRYVVMKSESRSFAVGLFLRRDTPVGDGQSVSTALCTSFGLRTRKLDPGR